MLHVEFFLTNLLMQRVNIEDTQCNELDHCTSGAACSYKKLRER